MFERLLVPLDGSKLAETVLPAAGYLSARLGASVVLIHVVEPDAPPQVHGQPHLRGGAEAEAYLQAVAARSFPPELRVEMHVHAGGVTSVTRSIVEHGAEFSSDLILMCTHGPSGARQFLFGNIAQQTMSLGTVPVLFLRATVAPPTSPFALSRLLVPLDGESTHEHSLPAAAFLAERCQASIHLLRVVPTHGNLSGDWVYTSRLLPGTTTRLLDLTEQEAKDYLDNRRAAMHSEQFQVTTEVLRGDPAEVVADVAHAHHADLIVMGTHGRVGTNAFWSGSVAPKICRACDTPVLLVPAHSSHESV
jgi:nucleotide-binding universal stress UspA family protein